MQFLLLQQLSLVSFTRVFVLYQVVVLTRLQKHRQCKKLLRLLHIVILLFKSHRVNLRPRTLRDYLTSRPSHLPLPPYLYPSLLLIISNLAFFLPFRIYFLLT
jgi:hypothetical protein